MRSRSLQLPLATLVLALAALPAHALFILPEIDASPFPCEFGDVEVGSSATAVVTISNIGFADLTVTSITVEARTGGDFSLVWAPELPVVLPPVADDPDKGQVEVVIEFAPSAAGEATGGLVIASDDPFAPGIEVLLVGTGVEPEVETPPTIEEVIAFFDESVENGTLQGMARGRAGRMQLAAMKNTLRVAQFFIKRGWDDWAWFVLMTAYVRCDGERRPPDFVTGEACPELAEMIFALMDSLTA
ncbi:MAG: choice-of-anchor D domain-containing protein [bacterium]|nr:choice-of-anchor D domain-containing protein [bacterium]